MAPHHCLQKAALPENAQGVHRLQREREMSASVFPSKFRLPFFLRVN
jgi:hypothetical protein